MKTQLDREEQERIERQQYNECEDDDSGIVEFCTYDKLIEKFGEEVAKNIIDLGENGEFWIDENGELIIIEI